MTSRSLVASVLLGSVASTAPGVAVAQIAPPPSSETAATPTPETQSGLPSVNVTPSGPFLSPPATTFQIPTARPVYGEAGGRRPGGLVLVPSLTIAEEYNDNVFGTNQHRRVDFISAISPGLALSYDAPTYHLAIAYSFTSLIYADHPELDNARGREIATLTADYRIVPNVILTLSDAYARYETPAITSAVAIATPGVTESTVNVLAPGMTWIVDTLTTVHVSPSWSTQHFASSSSATGGGSRLNNSDAYRFYTDVERRLTERLTGIAGYEFYYFDIERQPTTQTHTPRLGARYQITRQLTATVTAGPQFVFQDHDLSLKAAASADVTNRFSWGTASFNYARTTAPTSGVAGTAETNTYGALLQVTRLARGLILGVAPRYTTVSGDPSLDAKVLNISAQASYQFTPWCAMVAGYNFLQQRSGSTSPLVTDVDQNRTFLGLQLGYPVRLE